MNWILILGGAIITWVGLYRAFNSEISAPDPNQVISKDFVVKDKEIRTYTRYSNRTVEEVYMPNIVIKDDEPIAEFIVVWRNISYAP